MPWSNQSGGGGPWGSGGGGNNGNGNGRGPWGGGPSGGSQPPDLEDWLRRSKDGLKNFQGGGGLTPSDVLPAALTQQQIDGLTRIVEPADILPLTPLQTGLLFHRRTGGDGPCCGGARSSS